MMLSSLHPLSLFASLLLVASFVDVVNCQPGAAEQHSASATPPDEHLAVDFLLKSGVSIPLVGMGIGNLAHGEIPRAVRDQLASGVRLIDTAHASNNERILADAISDFDRSSGGGRGGSLRSGGGDGNGNDDDPIHVVTKVWYTHLGYERTKLSVAESLRELQLPVGSSRRILVHLLLHWPRCNDAISWMHCEEEEEKLPQSVKDAGPPPHSDMDNAFKESWRALEDIFLERHMMQPEYRHNPFVASIGVSNFDKKDMHRLLENARIPPHIYQGDSWLVFHDADLMDLLSEHQIFFQAYSVFGRILSQKEKAPRAAEILSTIASEVTSAVDEHAAVTEATILLAFFFHYDSGVIPRSSSPSHQRENSPEVVASVASHLTPSHIQKLERAISALMKGEDYEVVTVSFVNALSTAIQIHWMNPETKEESLISNLIDSGSAEFHESHPGHRFVAYDPDRQIRREFVVDAEYGEEQIFNVEL